MSDDEIRKLLQAALPAWEDVELKSDLWPRMLRRLEEPVLKFGWFEALLTGAVALTIAIYPRLLPAVLYHL